MCTWGLLVFSLGANATPCDVYGLLLLQLISPTQRSSQYSGECIPTLFQCISQVFAGGEMRARACGPVQNPGSTAGKRVYPGYKKNSTAYTPATLGTLPGRSHSARMESFGDFFGGAESSSTLLTFQPKSKKIKICIIVLDIGI
jgi:hypothetical protein